MYLKQHECENQKTTCRKQFLPSAVWDPLMTPWSLGLRAGYHYSMRHMTSPRMKRNFKILEKYRVDIKIYVRFIYKLNLSIWKSPDILLITHLQFTLRKKIFLSATNLANICGMSNTYNFQNVLEDTGMDFGFLKKLL